MRKPTFFTCENKCAEQIILIQNIDCWFPLEKSRRVGSNVYPKSMFSAKILKISDFSDEIFKFLQLKKSLWASGQVFIMQTEVSNWND